MKKPTLSDAKRIIRKANPGLKSLNVAWHRKPVLCDGFGDYKFYSALVRVAADGYRTKVMVMTRDDEGIRVG